MKIALLSETNTDEIFRHVPSARGHVHNGVEGLASAIPNVDIWHGRRVDAMLFTELERYDLLIINLNNPLWEIAIELRTRLPKKQLWGYQEGPLDVGGKLTGLDLSSFLGAIEVLDCMLCYDERALAIYKAFGARRVAWLPLPACARVYQETETAQKHNGVMVGQPLEAKRNTALSLLIAKTLPGATVYWHTTDNLNMAMGARLVSMDKSKAALNAMGYLQWVEPRDRVCFDGRRRVRFSPSFLSRLAECKLAIDLDGEACYGRFAVDCAGLKIPCVGSPRTMMQRILWGKDLCCEPWEFDRAKAIALRLWESQEECEKRGEAAQKILFKKFDPSVIAKLFEQAWTNGERE